MLAFLLIVGLSFGIMVSSQTSMVSSYLYNQRIRQDSLTVEKLATAVAPLFQSAAVETLSDDLNAAASELGGRLLVLDADGKVQADTFGELYGLRLQTAETLAILTGGRSVQYGIHTLRDDTLPQVVSAEGSRNVLYIAVPLIGTRGRLGVLFYVCSVDELTTSLSGIRREMLTVFIAIAAAALLFALLFSRWITRPVTKLTGTIHKMGEGDLSARAEVSGSREFQQLAENYNVMAAQLENLDRSRSRFVSNASHELKTPLAALKVSLETLIYQPDMPADLREEFMRDMDSEIDRLTEIITDLLTLSRLDSGDAGGLHMAAVDISQLSDRVVRKLSPIAAVKKQNVTTEIQPGLTAQADGARLEQVFSNLIDNAIKYTPEGGEVTVSLSRDRRTGELVWAVRDNGCGIPANDLPHVFDRFYRVSESRERTGGAGGTGLGLSIARQLVKMHGGTISVESEPGKGSVFTVRLPGAAAEVHA